MDLILLDRAAGALIGAGVGDALGAGYEFQRHSELVNITPAMIQGTFGTAPGEWTDDTSMTWGIAEAAAQNRDLLSAEALDQVAANFTDWYLSVPPDIGNQTRDVLSGARYLAGGSMPTAAQMTKCSVELYQENPNHSAGNGSLMRTAPVALAYVNEPDEQLIKAAEAVSKLTHGDPQCGEACAIWCLGIKQAILTGDIPNLGNLAEIMADAARVRHWRGTITQAETMEPEIFVPNGYVLTALQAAWSAITHTPLASNSDADKTEWFRQVLYRVIRVGHDTDTTATIAGALAGAVVGAANIPTEWVRMLHGYQNADALTLKGFAMQILAQQFGAK